MTATKNIHPKSKRSSRKHLSVPLLLSIFSHQSSPSFAFYPHFSINKYQTRVPSSSRIQLTPDDAIDQWETSTQNKNRAPGLTSGGHEVEVTYHNRSCKISVKPGESILSALERNRAKERLCLPSIPYDCRRGCCLTCSARHLEGSNKESLVKDEDGLVPSSSEDIVKEGYVLTCSSFVVGDGLKLKLFENDEAWSFMYGEIKKDAERIGREAAATTMRLAAERNVPKWKKETEKVFKRNVEYE